MTIPQVNWTYRAAPIRVIDGDTIVCLVDNGFRNREEHSIRLAGVDTPEIFSGTAEEKAAGQAAKALVQDWIADAEFDAMAKWPLIVQTEKDRQSFNRYVGRIWSTASGECLNDWLIARGYGT